MAKTLRTITVRELMEELEGQDPNARVIFTADYGDYHHTAQALPLKGECETVFIDESAYSNSGFEIAEYAEDETTAETFLVIR